MTSVRTAASLAVAALVLAGCALTGCAPEPAETPSPSSTPAVTHPTTTPAPLTTPSPAPLPSSTAPQTPETPAFTTAELARICIDVTISAYDGGVTFDPASARVEKRTVTPEWLVPVPARTNGYAAESVCTIGGSPADPQVELSSASIQPLPEDQIQKLIRGENEGG